VQSALRLVCVSLPHLAGLARLVRVELSARVATAAIFPSGRLVVNPAWFTGLDRGDATFVVAHELLHLALQTARRAAGTHRRLFNCAHDYIINDMLSQALGRPVPAGGLEWPGARELAAESLVQQLGTGTRAGYAISAGGWAGRAAGQRGGCRWRRAPRRAGGRVVPGGRSDRTGGGAGRGRAGRRARREPGRAARRGGAPAGGTRGRGLPGQDGAVRGPPHVL